MQDLPNTKQCFGCGTENQGGLHLRMKTDGARVVASWKPSENHAGFKGVVHGGILATALDEIMVWAVGVQTGRFCYCAELTVRFIEAASSQETLEIQGNLLENRKGRLFLAEARAANLGGKVITKATGKYIPLDDETANKMMEDFDQNAQSLLRRGRFVSAS